MATVHCSCIALASADAAAESQRGVDSMDWTLTWYPEKAAVDSCRTEAAVAGHRQMTGNVNCSEQAS